MSLFLGNAPFFLPLDADKNGTASSLFSEFFFLLSISQIITYTSIERADVERITYGRIVNKDNLFLYSTDKSPSLQLIASNDRETDTLLGDLGGAEH